MSAHLSAICIQASNLPDIHLSCVESQQEMESFPKELSDCFPLKNQTVCCLLLSTGLARKIVTSIFVGKHPEYTFQTSGLAAAMSMYPTRMRLTSEVHLMEAGHKTCHIY